MSEFTERVGKVQVTVTEVLGYRDYYLPSVMRKVASTVAYKMDQGKLCIEAASEAASIHGVARGAFECTAEKLRGPYDKQPRYIGSKDDLPTVGPISNAKPKKKMPPKPKKPAIPVFVAQRAKGFDSNITGALVDVWQNADLNSGIVALVNREEEFDSPTAMLLAGVYLNEQARQYIDSALDEQWAAYEPSITFGGRDVIIGGGLHAAIYAAIAHGRTGVKPLVITDSRVGGTFAMTATPSFYLNSRNRPGPLGLPMNMAPGSLNYIPGAPVQPADLSGDEYADNATLGWAIRMTLAMHADVYEGNATAIIPGGVMVDGTFIPARRLFIATGLGKPTRTFPQASFDGKRVMNYEQFMGHMATQQFPLQGIGRIAVVGGSDGGRTVIEALTGQGPSRSHLSVASLDYVERISWYSDNLSATCAGWEQNNRSRYKGIGRNLPRGQGRDSNTDQFFDDGTSRVKPVRRNVADVSVGYADIMVDGRPHDTVILATGYDKEQSRGLLESVPLTNSSMETIAGSAVARSWYIGSMPVFSMGPAASIQLTDQENQVNPQLYNVTENVDSIFRYARKTAAFAMKVN